MGASFCRQQMSSQASCQDNLVGTPTCSSNTSSDAEAAVSFKSESSKGGSLEAFPSESALMPSGEELSLTLQAYPHLRNTRAAKGWCPPPVISAHTGLLSPPHHRTWPSGLEVRGTAHGPWLLRWQPTAAAHPPHGNGGLPPCRMAARWLARPRTLPLFTSQGSRRPQLLRSALRSALRGEAQQPGAAAERSSPPRPYGKHGGKPRPRGDEDA